MLLLSISPSTWAVKPKTWPVFSIAHPELTDFASGQDRSELGTVPPSVGWRRYAAKKLTAPPLFQRSGNAGLGQKMLFLD